MGGGLKRRHRVENRFYTIGCATNKVSENLSLIEPNSVVEFFVGFVVEVHGDLCRSRLERAILSNTADKVLDDILCDALMIGHRST